MIHTIRHATTLAPLLPHLCCLTRTPRAKSSPLRVPPYQTRAPCRRARVPDSVRLARANAGDRGGARLQHTETLWRNAAGSGASINQPHVRPLITAPAALSSLAWYPPSSGSVTPRAGPLQDGSVSQTIQARPIAPPLTSPTQLCALSPAAGLVRTAVQLLELEVLVRDQVQRALLQLEPDDTLPHATRDTSGSVRREGTQNVRPQR